MTFTTLGSDQLFYLTWSKCPYPSYNRHHSDVDFGDGKQRSVWLCFEAMDNEKIPYATAPEPPDAARERKASEAREEAKRKAQAKKDGFASPPLVRMELSQTNGWYYTGDSLDDPVRWYVDRRVKEFQITPDRRSAVLKGLTGATWANRFMAFVDALPWVLGVAAFIWIATFVIGWIVRGFAGVPRGSDFRATGPAE